MICLILANGVSVVMGPARMNGHHGACFPQKEHKNSAALVLNLGFCAFSLLPVVEK